MSIIYNSDHNIIDFQVVKYIASISKQYNICDCTYSARRFEISSNTIVSSELIDELKTLINDNFKTFANITFNVNYNDSTTTVTFEYSIKEDFYLLYNKDKLPPILRERYVNIIENREFYSKLLNKYDDCQKDKYTLYMLLNTEELEVRIYDTNYFNVCKIINKSEEYPDTLHYIIKLLSLLEIKFMSRIYFNR